MKRKRILMACANHWHSPFQVGSHNLARGFLRAGWEVAFVSDPISPLHLARGPSPDLRRRFDTYCRGGERIGDLWTYVPGALLAPHNQPVLRSSFLHRHWSRLTWPNVVSLARRQGFGHVDLLYLDSLFQSFWLDALDYGQAVFRVTDYYPQYEKYCPAAHAEEQKIAQQADLVVYPSPQLQSYVTALGARRAVCLPNGVDYEHFARRPQPVPPEYRALQQPIAVYVGVIPAWFHFDWVRQAAIALPDMAFVLIGPDRLARAELGQLPNVHILGLRDYALVPGYLQHATVGIIPFDIEQDSAAVHAINPQKLYAYFAAGLPVVSADWQAIRELATPAGLCASAADFIVGLRAAVQQPGDTEARRRFARTFDWHQRVTTLLDELALIPHPQRRAA